MSQPEWMQKFKEIGQKSQRVDADGNVIVESMDDKFKKPPPVANTGIPPWMKEKQAAQQKANDEAAALFALAGSKPAVVKTDDEEEEEDAAALFAAAGSVAPVAASSSSGGLNADEDEIMVTNLKKMLNSGMPEGAGIQKMFVHEVPKDVQDMVLTPNDSAGGLTADEKEMVTKYKKMLKMGMPEGAVIQKMSVDEVPKHVQDVVLAPAEESVASPETEIIEEEVIEEVVEESVVSSIGVEETVHSDSVGAVGAMASEEPKQAVAGTASSSPTGSDQKMSDEEFGETWVVDKEQIINELSTTRFEEVEVSRDTGNIHYEEVYIDENGNEVVTSQGGDRAVSDDEEEIFVDEDGNEVEYEDEEVEEEEVVAASVQNREIKEEEVEEPVEPPYDPDYDVENQLKLLNRGSKAYRSRMAPWVPYVFFLALMAATVLILFFVVIADDDGIDEIPPTAAPTPRNFLPLNPTNTGAIDVAATTPMAPVTASCNFFGVPQPNVIDQCFCTGSISVIADDVRLRYESLLETFMPSVIPDFDEPSDSCDASNQALVWLSSGINNGGEAPDFVIRERYALAYFYLNQGGVGWRDNNLWISEVDVCLWDRVSCDANGSVLSLDVSDNRIIGQLSEAVSLLENIESFSIARNTLVGTIPSEILATPKLRALDLSSNSLEGGVPPFPGNSTLEIINFASNELSGDIQTTFGNVGSLSSLNLAGNAFQGSLPTELFRLPLQELYLASNDLSGTIPSAIANLTNLTSLTLGPNRFTGDLPVAIANLTNLTYLAIEDVPELTGRLPAEYGLNLTNLVQFILRDTDVRGNIPQQFGLMTALEVLDLSRNSLGRALPTELGLLTKLATLNLESNAFTETVPTEIGNAVEMTELKLHFNQLMGTIPSSIGRMSNLATLNLDANFFEGRAPDEICNLRQTNLEEFTVDCPERVNEVLVIGVICSVPSCCTECF